MSWFQQPALSAAEDLGSYITSRQPLLQSQQSLTARSEQLSVFALRLRCAQV
jgi:hypothetical protein